MFGKNYTDYIRFQAPVLALLAAVGLARLVLSLAGAPDPMVRYLSMTVVFFGGIVFYGLRVGRSGFGRYRHLLPLVFNQSLIFHAIAILGITLSAFGLPNVYDLPEFRGPGATAQTTALTHGLSHLFVGTTVGTLVGWGFGSLVMLIGGRPRAASSAAAPLLES